MELRSDAFPPGGWIPRQHTGDGADLSPPLHWSGVPEGTGAFALILDDPDAPPGLWIHWVLDNLPPELREVAEGVGPQGAPGERRASRRLLGGGELRAAEAELIGRYQRGA
jgi:phosphatidylethanolamine-binding protein (PEBP) family uncharacterized protein